MAPTPTASTPNDIDAIALALAGIDDLLRELDETLRNFQPPRRISPDQRATLQARIDRTIAAIDDIVRSTSVKGRSLLAGDGRIVLTADPATPPYQLRSIAPRALGGSRSRLFDIGSGEPRDLSRASLADVHKIVSRCSAQVALERRQFETFTKRPSAVSDGAARVAAENRAAAAQATADMDLVLATSQLSRGHLLAAVQTHVGRR
jgi:hypothetical protein